MKKYSDDYMLSTTIDVLRFPLAIAVIFIHMGPLVTNLIDADYNILSFKGLYNIIGIAFSHVIAHIAVPCFFFISGFLYFYNFKEWKWNKYKSKLKNRTKTLIIPYFVWNIVSYLLFIISYLFTGFLKDNSYTKLMTFLNQYDLNILYNCNMWGEGNDWLGNETFMTGPFDLPLWFLRDLIFMVIFTPVIYYFIKKLHIWYIFILFMAYISRIWTQMPGFNINSCFFFSLGAYFALNNINIISIARKYNIAIVATTLILLFVNIVYDGKNTFIGGYVYPYFIIISLFAVFYMTSEMINKYDLRPNKLLISSCFFIYAFHNVPLPGITSLLSLIKNIFEKIIPEAPLISYLISPLLIAFSCILIMIILKKYFPSVSIFFTGDR